MKLEVEKIKNRKVSFKDGYLIFSIILNRIIEFSSNPSKEIMPKQPSWFSKTLQKAYRNYNVFVHATQMARALVNGKKITIQSMYRFSKNSSEFKEHSLQFEYLDAMLFYKSLHGFNPTRQNNNPNHVIMIKSKCDTSENPTAYPKKHHKLVFSVDNINFYVSL